MSMSWLLSRLRTKPEHLFELNQMSEIRHRQISRNPGDLAVATLTPDGQFQVQAGGHIEICRTPKLAQIFMVRYYRRIQESGDDFPRHGSMGNMTVPTCCRRHNLMGYKDHGPCKGEPVARTPSTATPSTPGPSGTNQSGAV